MKSNVFGFSAKLALAVLAVSGTMLTSCYEEKGIDVTPVEPKPVTYIVAGSVYDAVTNAAIEAKVTASTGSLAQTGAAFRVTGLKANDVVTLTVTKDGYFTASRTVEVGVGAEGTTVVVNANIAISNSESAPVVEPVNPTPEVPKVEDQPKVDTPAALAELGLEGLTAPDGGKLAFDENGQLVATAVNKVELKPVTVDKMVTVDVERYNDSFVLTDIKKVTETKALADIDETTKTYLARCVANTINLPYAGTKFEKVKDKVEILQVANKTPIAVVANIVFNSRSLNFVVDGQVYSVIYMSCKTSSFGFAYDTHDSHDSHDKHDGHGGNPNAGGGIGGSDL